MITLPNHTQTPTEST